MIASVKTRYDPAPGRHEDPSFSYDAYEASGLWGVSRAEYRRFVADVIIKTYEAGDTVLHDGDEALHVMNIRAGSVKVYKQLSDGRRAVVGFLFSGDFAGLAAINHYSSGVEALEHVEVWRFPRAAFRQLVADMPTLETELLTRATHDLEVAQEHMLLLSRKTAMERLSSFLLQLARRGRGDAASLVHVRFHMTRADIGDYLGLSTETVSRYFTKLTTSKLIQLENPTGAILLNRRRLKGLAAGEPVH